MRELPPELHSPEILRWIAFDTALSRPPYSKDCLKAVLPSTRRRANLFVFPANYVWSWRRELNPRPSDYKSDALPTELRQQVEASPTKHNTP